MSMNEVLEREVVEEDETGSAEEAAVHIVGEGTA